MAIKSRYGIEIEHRDKSVFKGLTYSALKFGIPIAIGLAGAVDGIMNVSTKTFDIIGRLALGVPVSERQTLETITHIVLSGALIGLSYAGIDFNIKRGIKRMDKASSS